MFLSTEEQVLPWEIRIKIAIGIAQGLAFIHSIKNSSLFQELRMHNIMLDEQYNAKLLYLESHIQYMEAETRWMGDIIYTPPEPEGCEEIKSDVYTFGVILLELLTGSKDTIRNAKRSTSSHDWISPLLSDAHKIGEIVDPRLGNNYPVNAVTQMGTLIRRCTKWDMKKRPLMQQVLDTLNYIAEIMD
ncbi:unnamed protein product [Arabis nemorensis]|uniref:Protein kinase domain-containing protein n=1 Tax=Arabis nemorensis TaxID=586526 RepID=A0A565AUL6_9BRAS|nr:unnamed protein product [Arabis nemorensis]